MQPARQNVDDVDRSTTYDARKYATHASIDAYAVAPSAIMVCVRRAAGDERPAWHQVAGGGRSGGPPPRARALSLSSMAPGGLTRTLSLHSTGGKGPIAGRPFSTGMQK